MRHRRIRCGVLVAIAAAMLLASPGPQPLGPQPVEAQFDYKWCRVDRTIENRVRRVRGQVNTECGDECRFILPCHSAPWGNWGIASTYGGKIDGFQFAGWWPADGWLQWNSCTGRNIESEFNDGLGRQKSEPDDERVVHEWIEWYNAGYRNQDTCSVHLPSVRIDRDVELEHFELDGADFDDLVAILEYGDVYTPVTCSDAWNCSGMSDWYSATSTNGTGVSSEIRFTLQSSFSW